MGSDLKGEVATFFFPPLDPEEKRQRLWICVLQICISRSGKVRVVVSCSFVFTEM